MLSRFITIVALVAVAYWYWSDNIQGGGTSNYGQEVLDNAENMKKCIHAENYKVGATGQGASDPEQMCAERYNLYLGDDGKWHSYDSVRR